MASLRETKSRIDSVKGTLKITSAMKLVASSKLRKAQKAIENLRPYEEMLSEILSSLGGKLPKPEAVSDDCERKAPAATLVVAVSSNTSLCGGFNSNVIRKVSEVIASCDGPVEVYSVGRKMADAMRKQGYPSPADYNELVAHTTYETVAILASEIARRFNDGELSRVLLVYNHFVSTSKQVPVCETYLPFEVGSEENASDYSDFIIEPSPSEVVQQLLPQVLMMKFYAAVLDSVAAEHAARTVAMQAATDNGQDLLADLTLEYNKGRQQKITAEILDIVGGSMQ